MTKFALTPQTVKRPDYLYWASQILFILPALGLLLLASSNIRRCVWQQEKFQISWQQLALTQKMPAWFVRLGYRMIIPLGTPKRMSIFQPDLLVQLAAAYQANPWVEQVWAISKRYPHHINVVLTLRTPVALVYRTGTYYLVDRYAIRLPGRYAQPIPLGFFCPVLLGARGPVPAVGNVWSEQAVLEGISIAQLLATSSIPQQVPIEYIDISNVGGRYQKDKSEIVIRTRYQTNILWGRSPHSPRVHVDAHDLLRVFQSLLQHSELMRKFPAFKGIKEIDLRFKRPVFKR